MNSAAPIAVAALLAVVPLAVAEWDGVASADFWGPYNAYLTLLWLGLPLYVLAVRLRRWWRDRRDIGALARRSRCRWPRKQFGRNSIAPPRSTPRPGVPDEFCD